MQFAMIMARDLVISVDYFPSSRTIALDVNKIPSCALVLIITVSTSGA
jgi:hypothetical protein